MRATCCRTIALAAGLLAAYAARAGEVEMPKAVDGRLKIELVAAEPQIVTPTGIAVDQRGRVLVIESHTHFRPPNYQGPPADRIRAFTDADGDGRAEKIATFFEGTKHTMNLAVYRDGSVYVATRMEVFRLRDTNGDGAADERTPIVRLETTGDYPHNGLSGFAFDARGDVYFGMGENLGVPYKLIGSDGSTDSGAEGGHIFKCRPDGSKLERIATGFWNPFHVAFDVFDRLLAVDNDPDSMPPCRLLHVVPGGNYGFKFRNGRKGLHPFTAWNGQLPGTLPMVAGTGEAPSGIVAYESDGLPEDYRGKLLGTSWGDHRIEQFDLEPRGGSFRAEDKPIVVGGENFRPVGIAVAPDGSLVVSDWVDKAYEVHGKGRIWRIRSLQTASVERPTDPERAIRSAHRDLREQAARQLAASASGRNKLAELAKAVDDPRVRAAAIGALAQADDDSAAAAIAESQKLPALRAMTVRCFPRYAPSEGWAAPTQPAEVRCEVLRRVKNPKLLLSGVEDADPFVQQAARWGLTRSGAVSPGIDLAKLTPAGRLAALLILRESNQPGGEKLLPAFLKDSDRRVRFCAAQWIGEERLTEHRAALEAALSGGAVDGRLLAAYLAALERLAGTRRNLGEEWAPDEYLVKALFDEHNSPAVRRWALRTLRPDHPALGLVQLGKLVASGDESMQLEAVRTLRDSARPEATGTLHRLAQDEKLTANVRAEAVMALSPEEPAQRATLLKLAVSANAAVREEALRSLTGAKIAKSEHAMLGVVESDHPDSAELIDRLLAPGRAKLPSADDLDQWLTLLEGPARVDVGERIFFNAKIALCGRCHQVDGRGGNVGPDLSTTGSVLDRRRLVESILQPSREVAPQFVAWTIRTTDGRLRTGVLVAENAAGEQTYGDERGATFTVRPADLEERRQQRNSLMPGGVHQALTVQEFRDLLAYLRERR